MLYIETDKPDPVIEELLPVLGNKQPKVIAATLDALTQIYHAYGCKTIEPKPVLKVLPKAYGHADKNVRAKAQELTVELYRWLKEAMNRAATTFGLFAAAARAASWALRKGTRSHWK